MTLSEQVHNALNRLAKWRLVFASWQVGTRLKDDPEAAAIRDHREATIMHRLELNALLMLLIEKGVFQKDEFYKQLLKECTAMHEGL